MNISAPFIARPVATALLAVAVLLAGLLGYGALPVSALPQVDFPTIEISTQLPGASPEVTATLVTASLERQFGQITGLASMQSTSSEGTSQITLQFNLTRSMDGAAQDVQAAINAASGTLPSTLPYPPVYAKVNPADAPIITLALTSDNVKLDAVADAADTLLQPKLSQIDGVGKVTVQGGLRRAIRVRIDPARLAAYNLSMEDIRTAVAAANVNGAKGGFDGRAQAFALATNDQLLTPDAYRQLVISYKDAAPLRLQDVGTVVADVENTRVLSDLNGHPAVILDIQRQPSANIVQTVADIRTALPALEKSLPAGVTLAVVTDRTETIRASVADVQFTLLLAIALVIAVIYLFLGSWRATVIPGIALPLSLIGTFGVMSLLGFALDNLSLMALTVSTGFVVDDAIVMIENVVRYIEQGVPPLQAAYRGAKQIGFTIVSLTVSLVAVFIPLLFMTGVVGRLFNEFAVTLAVSVVVSAIVSLTLTPMMCGRLLRPFDPEHKQSWAARAFEAGFRRLTAGYTRTLAWALNAQALVLLIAVGTLAGTILLYIAIPKGFLPAQDTGVIVAVTEASQAISIPAMAKLQAQFAAVVGRDPAVASVTSFVGAGSINPTPNSGRPDHRAQATAGARPGRRRPGPPASRGQRGAGPERVHPARAGHPDRHPHQPHPIPVHPRGHGCRRTGALGAAPARPPERLARAAQRRLGPAGRRPGDQGQREPGSRPAPRRLDADHPGRALRQLRPAPDQHHLQPGQPIPRHPRGRPGVASRPQLPPAPARARRALRPGPEHHQWRHRQRRRAKPRPAFRRRQHQPDRRPARHHARAAIPERYPLLRSRPRRRAGGRRPGSASGRAGAGHARDRQRRVCRRRGPSSSARSPPNPTSSWPPSWSSTSCSAYCTRARSTPSRSCPPCPPPASARCWP